MCVWQNAMGFVENERIFRLYTHTHTHTHTHRESSIDVRKTALQPLEGKFQATAKAYGFFTIQQSQKV